MRWQFGVEPATQPQAHCPVVEARLCGYRDTKAGWDFIPAYVSELAYGFPPSIHGRQHADPACVPRRDRQCPRPSDRYGALPSRDLLDRSVGGHIVETTFKQFRLRRVGICQHLKALAPDR